MSSRSAEFPFFEVSEPARSFVPSFHGLEVSQVVQAPSALPNGPNQLGLLYPTLDEILHYWKASGGRAALPQAVFTPLKGSNNDAYEAVSKRRNLLLNPGGPLPVHSAGASYEVQAHRTVSNYFTSGPGARRLTAMYNNSPIAAFQNKVLKFEALYVQVCVIGENANGQPCVQYVIDQLWQIRTDSHRYFVAVELDGADKWDRNTLSKTNSRSFDLLGQGVMLCRLSSYAFNKSAVSGPNGLAIYSAKAQLMLDQAWKGLHMGYWLKDVVTAGSGQYTEEDAKCLLALAAVPAGTTVSAGLFDIV